MKMHMLMSDCCQRAAVTSSDKSVAFANFFSHLFYPLGSFRYSRFISHAGLVLELCVVLSSFLTLSPSASAQTEDREFSEQKALYIEQIEELEYQYGPLDRRLIEPLQALAELEEGRGDVESSAAFLRRQLQITRNAYGFEDPQLLPIYDALIRVAIAQSLWQEVSDTLNLRSQLVIGWASSTPGDDQQEQSAVSEQALRTAETLSLQADWLLQKVAFLQTREGVNAFFDAREIEEKIDDLARNALEELEEEDEAFDLEEFAQWARLSYRRALSDASLVQVLNAGGSFTYDALDYLTRREGFAAMQKLSSPGLGARFGASPLNRVPLLENGDPIGIGYLRDSYFTVKRLDTQLESWLESQGSDSENRPAALEMLAMLRIARGDFQIIQQRGSGIREYREAQALLLQAGFTQKAIDSYFSRPVQIPNRQLRLAFTEPADEECLSVAVLSERLPSVAQPQIDDPSLKLALPYAEFQLRFDVSRRGRASGAEQVQASLEDKRLSRTVRRSLSDLRFRPVVVDGRTQRTRDQCMTVRVPVLD